MADSTLNAFVASGTNAERLAFTPSPPTPASGPAPGYFWFETDTGDTWSWKAGTGWEQVNGVSGALLAANNLSDLADVATARTNLGLGTSATMDAEWAPNFTADGDVYIPAVEAMTIDQGNAAIGTGTITFEASTAATPGTFTTATLPVDLEAAAWLKVSAASVSGFCATHLKRTA